MSNLKEYGARLIAQGYNILPIGKGTKHPTVGKWQHIESDSKQLMSWLKSSNDDLGVGIITKYTPSIDIDITDVKMSKIAADIFEKHLGATIQRVGKAPKVLLVYRTDKPFPKITSPLYEDNQGNNHRVEILCDGQQFVAYHEHPQTKKPYTWVSEKSLADVSYNDLPLVRISQIERALREFERSIPLDWRSVQRGTQLKQSEDDPDINLLNSFTSKCDVTKEEIISTLAYVSANDYGVWVQVGMALFHQFDGENDGLKIWDEWSQTSEKYQESSVSSRWNTFDTQNKVLPNGPVTWASVIKLADTHQQGEQSLDDFIRRYVYVLNGDGVCDLCVPPSFCVSRITEFKNSTANIRHEVPWPTNSNPKRTKLAPVSQAWLTSPFRMDAHGQGYFPGEGRLYVDENGLRWVNKFAIPKLLVVEGDLDIFFGHMEYLIPDEIERKWFIQWIAFNLQYPEKRCKVTPLHISHAHGVGRGWVVELMGKLLGIENCKKTKMGILSGEGSAGQYQDYLDQSIFCAVEEVKESGQRFSVSDKIRDLLTENYLEVNVKYGGKKTQRVYTNFFFMSNHRDAMILKEEDRRINVLTGPENPRDQSYYTKIYDWLAGGHVGALQHYLLALDISDFNSTRSLNTQGRRNLIGACQTATEMLLKELRKNPPRPVMTYRGIVNEMIKISGGDQFDHEVDESQLTHLLRQECTYIKPIKVKGVPKTSWQLVPGKTYPKEKVRELLAEEIHTDGI